MFIFSSNLLSCWFSTPNARLWLKLYCLYFLLFLLLICIILFNLCLINNEIILKINLLLILKIDNKIIIFKLLIIFVYSWFVYSLLINDLFVYDLFVYWFFSNLTIGRSGKITDFSMCTFNNTIKDIIFDIISIMIINTFIKTMILKLFELFL